MIEVVEAPDKYSIVMEYVQGSNLLGSAGARVLARPILRQILAALAHLHSNGLHHNNLIPANVIVIDKQGTIQVKLTDYSSLEASAASEDARVDDFRAFVAIAYHLFTGEPLHQDM